jgi:hypothetical protein
MLSVGEDVEADALSKRGWTISAIARHLGRDRKTVRSYLSGERVPGARRPGRPDALVGPHNWRRGWAPCRWRNYIREGPMSLAGDTHYAGEAEFGMLEPVATLLCDLLRPSAAF